MAAQLVEEMVRAGAQAAVDPEMDLGPRSVVVRVDAPGGATVHVDFDGGSSQPDVHVCTWNVRGAVFFAPEIGDVNRSHYSKATRICHGFDDLVDTLRRDVAQFASGYGYMKPDDPRLADMRGRYAEKGWFWPPSR